jgi:hypothetical protein
MASIWRRAALAQLAGNGPQMIDDLRCPVEVVVGDGRADAKDISTGLQ